MFGLGPPELILILVIALVLFGPGKLPDLGSALGKGIKEFRKSVSEASDAIQEEPANTAPAEKPVAKLPSADEPARDQDHAS